MTVSIRIKYFFVVFSIFCSVFKYGYSQNIRLTAGTVCTDGVVSVPVSVQNMQNVYGFNMLLHYDQSIMNFTSYNVLNPALFGTLITNDALTGTVSMQIPFDTTAISINGYMYVLNFSLTSLTSSLLIWDTVQFSDLSGAPLPVTLINGAVITPPLLTQQPLDQTVCEGSGQVVSFSIQTADTLHLINWQVSYNNGLNWLTLINDVNYQGVNSQLLSISSPHVQMHHNLYRCRLSGACEYISDVAALEVFGNISLHPHDTVIDIGGTAVFAAEGTGSAPVYLWEVSTDGGNTWSSSALFPAVTTPSLTLVNPPLSWHGYKLRCIITGACAPQTDTSDVATLWIGTAGMAEEKHFNIELYPNPVQEYTNVILVSQISQKAHYRIYNATGLNIMSEYVYLFSGTNRINIKTETLQAGLYFIRIDFKNGDFKRLKFIK